MTVNALALYKLDTQSTIAISRLTVKNNMPPNETFPDDSILPKRERFPLCELHSLNGILEDGKVKGNSVSDYFVATRSLNSTLDRRIRNCYLQKSSIKKTDKFIPWS